MASRRPNPRGAGKPPPGTTLDLSHPLAQGLVAAWNFVAGAGTMEPDAALGLAPVKLGAGVTYQPFSADMAIRQPGAAAVVSIAPDQPAIYNLSRLSAFVNVTFNTLNGTSNNHIFNRLSSGLVGYSMYLNPLGPNIKGKIFDGTTTVTATSTAIALKQTFHYGFTYDGATIRLYIAGKLNTTAAGAVTLNVPVATMGFMNLGASPTAASSCDGWLSSVKLYNRVLSADEVAALDVDPFGMFLSERQQAPAVTSLMASPRPKRLVIPDRPPPYPLL